MQDRSRAQASSTTMMVVAAILAAAILGVYLATLGGVHFDPVQPWAGPAFAGYSVRLYEKTFTTQAPLLDSDGTQTVPVSITRTLERLEDKDEWRVSTLVQSESNRTLEGVYVSQPLAFIRYQGNQSSDYAGVRFRPQPARIQPDENVGRTNVVVTWLFQSVTPGQ
ncbi:MAG: hypothetical protein Q8P02_01375, partial [Candidatus Micrarchaeota archaeon]|nr:hypothetical protein [Candidatus Micrarchaeota archaeon]